MSVSRRPGSADGGAIMRRAYIADTGPLGKRDRERALRLVARHAIKGLWPLPVVVDVALMLGLVEIDHGER